MANSKIFCGVPWYELNINNDGSFDLCGCQNDKIRGTAVGQVWNIKKIPILEYWNSTRMRESRLVKLGDVPDPMCRMCQRKDEIGYNSTRQKENSKSVIFSEAFERSFLQSPNYHRFKYSKDNQGYTQTTPHSLHINLGDACNFACRMCHPIASSKLQHEFKILKWIEKDSDTRYFERLSKYKRTEIGISIESVGPMGDYIRQGGKIDQILKNIEQIDKLKPENMSLVIRTVPGLLSLPTYADIIDWSWKHNIPMDNSLQVNPPWQVGLLLPDNIKTKIISNIQKILDQVPGDYTAQLNNQKDRNKINTSIRNECESIIKYLQQPAPSNANELLHECAVMLDQWDKMKQINIKNYSTELYELLNKYGYSGA